MIALKILCALNLAGLIAVAILLVALLRRRSTPPAEDITQAVTKAVTDALRRDVTEPILRSEREGQTALRTELQSELRGSRTETAHTVQDSVRRLGQDLRESQKQTAELQAKSMTVLTEAQERQFALQDKRIEAMEKGLNTLLTERMDGLGNTVGQRLAEVDKQFREFRESSTAAQELLRRTMEERVTAMQNRNAEQLEQMRLTVDEKLQKTLDERISQSFKAVNDRLGDVYRGLGEMQKLAGEVGDLKKVMSGVKTRGILGEIQLGALMQEMLAPEQYEENIATVPGSSNRVEFAVRLPGDGDTPVYLPIDAKFPADAYAHLVDAYEAADPDRIKEASAALETRIKACAKDIRDKYVAPPHTTKFGILFLPFESLYAEAVRLGLAETLRRDYEITIAGPTTLAALLSSLQMGFRTLAIQKRSDEVWQVLGAVKTEFGKFGTVLTKAQERIEQTSRELDTLVGVRTRQINRRLGSVSELPSTDAQRMLDAAGEE